MTAPPPLVVVRDTRERTTHAAAAAALGWAVVDGFDVPEPEWSLRERNLVCVGELTDRQQVSAAVLAAVRGAGLVVTVVPELAPLLLGDLARIGVVVSTWPGSTVGFRVREEDAELLRCVAEGHSVTEAARLLNVSRRTAHRRLERARRELNARTTAEAAAKFVSSTPFELPEEWHESA